jgi:hypothetical protein
MFKRIEYRILSTVICTFVFVSIAAAHEVRISPLAKVGNGPELQAGTYRVEVVKNQDSVEVHFYQEGEVVATAPAVLAKEAAKSNFTKVYSEKVDGGQMITKIWLQGSKESLVFKPDIPRAE